MGTNQTQQLYLGQKSGRSGGLGAEPDEVWQIWSVGLCYTQAVSEEVPERDAQLGTGQQQAEEGVAALAALIGVGPAGDLALDHLRSQIALGAVGVQRHLGTVQHPQQLVLVGM